MKQGTHRQSLGHPHAAARPDVPHFRMREPAQRPPSHDQPAANAGADGDVGHAVQSGAGPKRRLRNPGGRFTSVSIATGQCKASVSARRSAKPDPSGLGRAQDGAKAARCWIEIERPEAADTDRLRWPVRRPGRSRQETLTTAASVVAGSGARDRDAPPDFPWGQPRTTQVTVGSAGLDPGQHGGISQAVGRQQSV